MGSLRDADEALTNQRAMRNIHRTEAIDFAIFVIHLGWLYDDADARVGKERLEWYRTASPHDGVVPGSEVRG